MLLVSDFAWAFDASAFRAQASEPAALKAVRALPASTVMVEEIHVGQGPTLLLFRDAHTNPSAQLNLANTLKSLVHNRTIEWIFAEGGAGDNSLAALRSGIPAGRRDAAALKWLRRGEMKGTEYLSLMDGLDFQLWGVEDPGRYRQSVDLYRRAAQDRRRLMTYLSRYQSAASAVRERIYSPDLLEFDRGRDACRQSVHESAACWAELVRMAEKNGIPAGSIPRLTALDRLRRREARLEAFAASGKAVPAKEIAAYDRLARRILTPELFAEARQAEKLVYRRLAVTHDAARLVDMDERLRAFGRWVELRAEPDDWKAFESDPASVNLVEIGAFLNRKVMDLGLDASLAVTLDPKRHRRIQEVFKFYRLARERDDVFLDQTAAKMTEQGIRTAALVTGGFHTDRLTALLRERGWSYAVLTPRVTEPTDQLRYERLLLKKPTTEASMRLPAQSMAAAARVTHLDTPFLRLGGMAVPGTLPPVYAFAAQELGIQASEVTARFNGTVPSGARMASAAQEYLQSLREHPEEKENLVLIVGAGPAGLRVGELLLKNGYKYALFDREGAMGGLGTFGIPPVRGQLNLKESVLALAKRVLAGVEGRGKSIPTDEEIRNSRMKFFPNTSIGEDISFDELKALEVPIFVATGAQKPRRLGIPGEDLDNVVSATSQFFKAVNKGWFIKRLVGEFMAKLGRKPTKDEINVVYHGKKWHYGLVNITYGGGNVAADAALDTWENAKVGSKTLIIYRGPSWAMPSMGSHYRKLLDEREITVLGLYTIEEATSEDGSGKLTNITLRKRKITGLKLRVNDDGYDFNADEFVGRYKVDNLFQSMRRHVVAVSELPLDAEDHVKLAVINEMMAAHNIYDLLSEEKKAVKLPTDLQARLDSLDLNASDSNDIQKLNRQIIEIVFSDESPKRPDVKPIPLADANNNGKYVKLPDDKTMRQLLEDAGVEVPDGVEFEHGVVYQVEVADTDELYEIDADLLIMAIGDEAEPLGGLEMTGRGAFKTNDHGRVAGEKDIWVVGQAQTQRGAVSHSYSSAERAVDDFLKTRQGARLAEESSSSESSRKRRTSGIWAAVKIVNEIKKAPATAWRWAAGYPAPANELGPAQTYMDYIDQKIALMPADRARVLWVIGAAMMLLEIPAMAFRFVGMSASAVFLGSNPVEASVGMVASFIGPFSLIRAVGLLSFKVSSALVASWRGIVTAPAILSTAIPIIGPYTSLLFMVSSVANFGFIDGLYLMDIAEERVVEAAQRTTQDPQKSEDEFKLAGFMNQRAYDIAEQIVLYQKNSPYMTETNGYPLARARRYLVLSVRLFLRIFGIKTKDYFAEPAAKFRIRRGRLVSPITTISKGKTVQFDYINPQETLEHLAFGKRFLYLDTDANIERIRQEITSQLASWSTQLQMTSDDLKERFFYFDFDKFRSYIDGQSDAGVFVQPLFEDESEADGARLAGLLPEEYEKYQAMKQRIEYPDLVAQIRKRGIDPSAYGVIVYPAAGNHDDPLIRAIAKSFGSIEEVHLISLSYANADSELMGRWLSEMKRRTGVENIQLHAQNIFAFSPVVKSKKKRILIDKGPDQNALLRDNPAFYQWMVNHSSEGDLVLTLPTVRKPYAWTGELTSAAGFADYAGDNRWTASVRRANDSADIAQRFGARLASKDRVRFADALETNFMLIDFGRLLAEQIGDHMPETIARLLDYADLEAGQVPDYKKFEKGLKLLLLPPRKADAKSEEILRSVDPDARLLTRDDLQKNLVPFGAWMAEVNGYLERVGGQPVTREQFIDAVYGPKKANPYIRAALDDLLAIQQRLGVKFGMVVNFEAEGREYLTRFLAENYPGLFDERLLFISAEEGFLKEEAELFDRILRRFEQVTGQKPQHPVFFDNQTNGFAPAAKNGIAFHVHYGFAGDAEAEYRDADFAKARLLHADSKRGYIRAMIEKAYGARLADASKNADTPQNMKQVLLKIANPESKSPSDWIDKKREAEVKKGTSRKSKQPAAESDSKSSLHQYSFNDNRKVTLVHEPTTGSWQIIDKIVRPYREVLGRSREFEGGITRLEVQWSRGESLLRIIVFDPTGTLQSEYKSAATEDPIRDIRVNSEDRTVTLVLEKNAFKALVNAKGLRYDDHAAEIEKMDPEYPDNRHILHLVPAETPKPVKVEAKGYRPAIGREAAALLDVLNDAEYRQAVARISGSLRPDDAGFLALLHTKLRLLTAAYLADRTQAGYVRYRTEIKDLVAQIRSRSGVIPRLLDPVDRGNDSKLVRSMSSRLMTMHRLIEDSDGARLAGDSGLSRARYRAAEVRILFADAPAGKGTVREVQERLARFGGDAAVDEEHVGVDKDELWRLIGEDKPAILVVRSTTNVFRGKDEKELAEAEKYFAWAQQNGVKKIIRAGAGTDNIHKELAARHGIDVIATGGNDQSVGELAARFLLAGLRATPVSRDKKDLAFGMKPLFGAELDQFKAADVASAKKGKGKTLPEQAQRLFANLSKDTLRREIAPAIRSERIGLVGYGRTAEWFAQAVRNIDRIGRTSTPITAYSPSLAGGKAIKKFAAKKFDVTAASDRSEVISNSTILSLHMTGEAQNRLTPAEEELLLANRDLRMLINTVRLNMVSVPTLRKLAERGVLIFMDVDFNDEVRSLLAEYPDRVFATPHIAASTQLAADGVELALKNALPDAVVDLYASGSGARLAVVPDLTSQLADYPRPVHSIKVRRVLVNEDNASMRLLLKRIIHRMTGPDTQIVFSNKSEDARDLIDRGERFDLILTDFDTWSAMDGYQLIRHLRQSADDEVQKTPVLFMSGSFEAVFGRYGAYDADALGRTTIYLPKPFDLEQIRIAVETMSGARGARLAGKSGWVQAAAAWTVGLLAGIAGTKVIERYRMPDAQPTTRTASVAVEDRTAQIPDLFRTAKNPDIDPSVRRQAVRAILQIIAEDQPNHAFAVYVLQEEIRNALADTSGVSFAPRPNPLPAPRLPINPRVAKAKQDEYEKRKKFEESVIAGQDFEVMPVADENGLRTHTSVMWVFEGLRRTVQREAIIELGRANAAAVLPAVVDALKDASSNIRLDAIDILSQIGDPSAIPALKRTQESTSEKAKVRKAAAEAMKTLEASGARLASSNEEPGPAGGGLARVKKSAKMTAKEKAHYERWYRATSTYFYRRFLRPIVFLAVRAYMTLRINGPLNRVVRIKTFGDEHIHALKGKKFILVPNHVTDASDAFLLVTILDSRFGRMPQFVANMLVLDGIVKWAALLGIGIPVLGDKNTRARMVRELDHKNSAVGIFMSFHPVDNLKHGLDHMETASIDVARDSGAPIVPAYLETDMDKRTKVGDLVHRGSAKAGRPQQPLYDFQIRFGKPIYAADATGAIKSIEQMRAEYTQEMMALKQAADAEAARAIELKGKLDERGFASDDASRRMLLREFQTALNQIVEEIHYRSDRAGLPKMTVRSVVGPFAALEYAETQSRIGLLTADNGATDSVAELRLLVQLADGSEATKQVAAKLERLYARVHKEIRRRYRVAAYIDTYQAERHPEREVPIETYYGQGLLFQYETLVADSGARLAASDRRQAIERLLQKYELMFRYSFVNREQVAKRLFSRFNSEDRYRREHIGDAFVKLFISEASLSRHPNIHISQRSDYFDSAQMRMNKFNRELSSQSERLTGFSVTLQRLVGNILVDGGFSQAAIDAARAGLNQLFDDMEFHKISPRDQYKYKTLPHSQGRLDADLERLRLWVDDLLPSDQGLDRLEYLRARQKGDFMLKQAWLGDAVIEAIFSEDYRQAQLDGFEGMRNGILEGQFKKNRSLSTAIATVLGESDPAAFSPRYGGSLLEALIGIVYEWNGGGAAGLDRAKKLLYRIYDHAVDQDAPLNPVLIHYLRSTRSGARLASKPRSSQLSSELKTLLSQKQRTKEEKQRLIRMLIDRVPMGAPATFSRVLDASEGYLTAEQLNAILQTSDSKSLLVRIDSLLKNKYEWEVYLDFLTRRIQRGLAFTPRNLASASRGDISAAEIVKGIERFDVDYHRLDIVDYDNELFTRSDFIAEVRHFVRELAKEGRPVTLKNIFEISGGYPTFAAFSQNIRKFKLTRTDLESFGIQMEPLKRDNGDLESGARLAAPGLTLGTSVAFLGRVAAAQSSSIVTAPVLVPLEDGRIRIAQLRVSADGARLARYRGRDWHLDRDRTLVHPDRPLANRQRLGALLAAQALIRSQNQAIAAMPKSLAVSLDVVAKVNELPKLFPNAESLAVELDWVYRSLDRLAGTVKARELPVRFFVEADPAAWSDTQRAEWDRMQARLRSELGSEIMTVPSYAPQDDRVWTLELKVTGRGLRPNERLYVGVDTGPDRPGSWLEAAALGIEAVAGWPELASARAERRAPDGARLALSERVQMMFKNHTAVTETSQIPLGLLGRSVRIFRKLFVRPVEAFLNQNLSERRLAQEMYSRSA